MSQQESISFTGKQSCHVYVFVIFAPLISVDNKMWLYWILEMDHTGHHLEPCTRLSPAILNIANLISQSDNTYLTYHTSLCLKPIENDP